MVREGPDFNTVDAFRLLDSEGKGEVDLAKLRKGLTEQIKIEAFSNEKLALFFGRFDKQKRAKIKYSQYCDAFVPKSQTVL